MARGRHGGSRRKTQWSGMGSHLGAAVLPEMQALTTGTPVILSFNAVVAGGVSILDEEFTVTRMIGAASVSLNVDTALDNATVALGCAVARNEAITAGVASLPSPEDDPDFEWLYYGVYQLQNPQNALRDGPISATIREFDVRGQRIVRAGQSLIWIAESQGGNCMAGVSGRYLLKLT